MGRGIPSFNRDCQSAICVYIYNVCTYNKYNYFDVHTCTVYVTVYTCTCIIHNITWYYPTSVYTAFPLF